MTNPYILGVGALVIGGVGFYAGLKTDSLLDSIGLSNDLEGNSRVPSFVLPAVVGLGAIYIMKRRGVV